MNGWGPQRKYVFLVLAICLVLRVCFWVAVQPWDPAVEHRIVTTNDAPDYHALAINMIEKGVFQSYLERITCLRTPGYPLYVAAHYLLAGPAPWVVLLSQCLLETLSCFLLMVLVAMFLSRLLALIAGFFYALYPIAVLNTANLLSDVFFVFTILLFSCLVMRIFKDGSKRFTWLYPALAGLALGFAALVRPVAVYLPVLLVFLFVFQRQLPLRSALGRYAILTVFFLAAVVPWMVRNYNHYGVFSFSTSGAYNLLILNAGPLMNLPELKTMDDYYAYLFGLVDREIEKEGLNPNELNDFQKADHWKKYALNVISSKPVAFFKSYVMGIGHTFLNLSSSEFALAFGQPRNRIDIKATANPVELLKEYLAVKGALGIIIMILVGGYYLVAYGCLIIGLIEAVKRGWSPFFTFSVIMPLYFALITGAAGLSRFGLPAYPFVLVFSAMGALRVWERLMAGRRPKGSLAI